MDTPTGRRPVPPRTPGGTGRWLARIGVSVVVAGAALTMAGCGPAGGPPPIAGDAAQGPWPQITHGPARTPMAPPDDPGTSVTLDPNAPSPTATPTELRHPGVGVNGDQPPPPPTASCARERATLAEPLASDWQDVKDLGVQEPSGWLQEFVNNEDSYADYLQDRDCDTAESRALHEAVGQLVVTVNAHRPTHEASQTVDAAMAALRGTR